MTSNLSCRRLMGAGWVLALTLGGITACGGGGVEVQGTGQEPPTYANGPITGFGSIIVGGVHYDESAATIRNDDGTVLTRDDLRLGMVVSIDGKNLNQTTATATANAVVTGSDLVGPVTANLPASGQMTVLGQAVRVTVSTVFDDKLTAGQSSISVGQAVQVYSIYDPVTQVYTATRIEPKTGLSSYKIRGAVSQLDAALRTFNIGGAGFSYTASTAPSGLANGAMVLLRVALTPDANGRWVIGSSEAPQRVPSDDTDVEAEGVISSYSSNASFVVKGITVNASTAAITPAGSSLAAGVRVETEGRMKAGVLQATKIEVKKAEDSGGGSGGGSGNEYEITSTVQTLDTVAKTFVLKAGAQKVDYSSAVFKDGKTAADLKVGAKLEVKGRLSADGTLVVASEIKFDN